MREETKVQVKTAIAQELENTVLLKMAETRQSKEHQYSFGSAQYAIIIKNRRTGTNTGQPKKRDEYAYHELRRCNAADIVWTKMMF